MHTWIRDVAPDLRMRRVSSAEDVERVAAFDAQIHGAGSEVTWRTWMTLHPSAREAHWLLVEDLTCGKVVASLCLLPWRLQFGGVELRAGEMGVVGSDEAYRGRGLQRALAARFAELLVEGGFDLSQIQGIPYFYRQFGYEYAVPLEAWWRLELHMVPSSPPPSSYTCRLANFADLPELVGLYDQAAATLDLAALRDEALWRYLLGSALLTETAAETWLVCDPAGGPVGYFRVARQGFGEALIVAEASLLAPEAALAALIKLRQLTEELRKPFVRLNLPAHTPLVRLARSLGAYDGHAYAWQIRVPKPAALLRKLAPVFEQRLAASMYAGLNRSLVLDLYRQRLAMSFVAGRLTSVTVAPDAAPADVSLPPHLFAPLLCGHRSLDAMNHMYPDAFAPGSARTLLDTLFPTLSTWLYQPY